MRENLLHTLAAFADAGVPPVLIPIAGGLCVSGLLLATAAVFGGLWLIRGSTASRERRRFFLATAVGCLVAAVPVALLGTTKVFEYWIAAAVVAVVGLLALRKFRQLSYSPAERSDSPTR